jgi:hypothetical protein
VLADLAYTGSDISSVLGAIRQAAKTQPDDIARGALSAIQAAGDAQSAEDAAAIAADGARSEEVRTSAAAAAAACFTRGVQATDAATAALTLTIASDAPLSVRAGAARALGAIKLSPADRAGLLTGHNPETRALGYVDDGG